ncbi:Uncharacterised protein [Rhodococcus gordoniae]|uniref:Uncharacterized protein n=1 Tax=Rhodococcus gordoniae TaxID=223392 RepID=A0A379PQV6_9NOCA|nr:Uncharacterised protein [Rhodococcus gordoniae]
MRTRSLTDLGPEHQTATSRALPSASAEYACVTRDACTHRTHCTHPRRHGFTKSWIPPLAQLTRLGPDNSGGNSLRHGHVALAGSGAFSCPPGSTLCLHGVPFGWSRAAPFAERRPNAPDPSFPLRAGTLRWRGPVPACLAQRPAGTQAVTTPCRCGRGSVPRSRPKLSPGSDRQVRPALQGRRPSGRRGGVESPVFQHGRDRGRSDVLSARVPARPRHLGCG